MKGVQCYELFRGIALKIYTFSFRSKYEVYCIFLFHFIYFLFVFCQMCLILNVTPFLHFNVFMFLLFDIVHLTH